MGKYLHAFVILNYNIINETIDCIESIIKHIKNQNYYIIVVDNGSSKAIYDELYDYIHSLRLDKLILLKNSDNLGFACGNNVGFKYAKYELNADFILQINNDTIIAQADMLDILEDEFERTCAFVIGPDIYAVKQKLHQNPQPTITYNLKYIGKNILNSLCHIVALNLKIEDLIKNPIVKRSKDVFDYTIEQDNVTLHGSALYFTPLYLAAYDGMFDKTFLYREENILFYLLRADKHKMRYCPKLRITHLEDVSTDSSFDSNRKRRIFYYKNLLKSDLQLLKLIMKRG